MFSSLSCSQQPGRSRFSSCRAGLYLVKVLPAWCLTAFVLFSLTTQTAQAQALPPGWNPVPCDANGKTNVSTGFSGPVSGSATPTGTYQDIEDYILANPDGSPGGNYADTASSAASYLWADDFLNPGATVQSTVITADAQTNSGQTGGGTNAWNHLSGYGGGFFQPWTMSYPGEPIVGSVSTQVSGTLTAYFKLVWQGGGAQPSYPPSLGLKVQTTLIATGSLNYPPDGSITSGLTSTASASDNFDDSISSSLSSPDDAPPPTLTKLHLVQAPVDGGQASRR